MKKLILSIFILVAAVVSGFSQDDVEGCKDHAILTRMSAYFISSCSDSYNQAEIVTGNAANGDNIRKTIEGNVISIEYNQKEGVASKLPSWFQIVKNYENALGKIGGKKIFGDGMIATFHLNP
jgi:hypothetical protein